MKTSVTIAFTHTCHNKAALRAGAGAWLRAMLAGLLCVLAAGCSVAWRRPAATAEVPVWELANARPIAARPVGRARVDCERPLPSSFAQSLCTEFTLVCITNATNWADLRGRCGLATSPEELDFSQGAVVGLIANIGEGARGIWPIELDEARVQKGQGCVEFDFAAGVYYPVRTAGYLELAYVPGLREVQMVRVGQRRFIIRSGAGH
jgi:hypothetical protein